MWIARQDWLARRGTRTTDNPVVAFRSAGSELENACCCACTSQTLVANNGQIKIWVWSEWNDRIGGGQHPRFLQTHRVNQSGARNFFLPVATHDDARHAAQHICGLPRLWAITGQL